MHNRTEPFIVSRLLRTNSKDTSDSLAAVLIHTARSSGHPMNIDKYVYSDKYLKLIVDKSHDILIRVKPFTTHVIDVSRTKFKVMSYNGKKSSNTFSLPFLCDNMGLFINVSPPHADSYKDGTSLLNISELPNCLCILKFGDDLYQIVGDSTYVEITLEFNSETKMYNFKDLIAEEFFGIP